MTLLETLDVYKNGKNGQAIGNWIRKIKANHNGWFDEIKQLTIFLNQYYDEISVAQRLYHVWFNEQNIENCPICDKPKKFYAGFSSDRHKHGNTNYHKTCGSISCHKIFSNQAKIDGIHKLHADPIRHAEWVKIIKKNNLEKFGVEWIVKADFFTQKSKNTCIRNHGVDNGAKCEASKLKSKKTCLAKYGTEYFLQSQEKKNKTKEFYNNKFGVDHNMQVSEIFNKLSRTRYKSKNYKFLSGKIIKIQGYENIAIDELLNTFKENDLIIGNKNIENYIGKIWYNFNNKKHRYYPDIYIISLNKIVEVKSTWTYKVDNYINKLKEKATIDAGFLFEFYVYDKEKNKIIV